MAGEGFKYYNIDTDRYQDMKIKRLKKAFSCVGISIYDYILCEIYRVKGYCIDWDDNACFDIAEYFGIEEQTVIDVVAYCCEIGLFCKGLFEENHVLTARSIQIRFEEMSKRAKRLYAKIPEELNVIQEKEVKVPEEVIIVQEEVVKVLEEKNTWKTDFSIYLSDLREAFSLIKLDTEWISKQELYNPNVDVILSIEKSCTNYWATEAGWKKKRASKVKSIDWKSTFANAISINKVYKNKDYAKSNGVDKRELRPVSEDASIKYAKTTFGN